MTNILLFAAIAMLAVVLFFIRMLFRQLSKIDPAIFASRFDTFEKTQERIEHVVKDEITRNRDELNKTARDQRQELTEVFKTLSDSVAQRMTDITNMQKGQLDAFSSQLASFAKASGERLDAVRAESATGAKQLREEVISTLSGISETTTKTIDGIRVESSTGAKHLREEVIAALKGITEATNKMMGDSANLQKSQLESMSVSIEKLVNTNEKKLEAIRITVEGKLESMQIDNAKQLEQMRQTVDEKLQGTLEKRLGESFKQVSERLELVHKGLGEMQTLATGVGDLKKVLTNVKTRGTWGEVQLGVLLEQVLNPDQFATNVSTKDDSERVEFAIKLPGQGVDKDETVWLPIDAKFPIEDYQRLIEAQEKADIDGVEAAGKQLDNSVKSCAWTICSKYLNPPKTTDFGILFLPIEGLFAEVIRRTGLTEAIQRECRVVIAGPTTLWSILSSLQMGFRTLAIQKRSSEVWNLLGAVKTEWTKYGDVLDAVQTKLHQASDTIEKAKVRSRAVGRKLKDVQELPAGEATNLLTLDGAIDDKIDGEDEGA